MIQEGLATGKSFETEFWSYFQGPDVIPNHQLIVSKHCVLNNAPSNMSVLQYGMSNEQYFGTLKALIH